MFVIFVATSSNELFEVFSERASVICSTNYFERVLFSRRSIWRRRIRRPYSGVDRRIMGFRSTKRAW